LGSLFAQAFIYNGITSNNNSSRVTDIRNLKILAVMVEFQKDKYQATNTYIKVGYEFSKKANLTIFNNFDRDVYDYDAGAFTDSDVNNGINKQNRIGLSSNYKYNKGSFKIVASFNENNREFDSFNGWTGAIDHFEYKGKSVYVDLVNDYKFSDKIQLITGINYQNQSNHTNSPYGDIDAELAKYNMLDPYVTAVYNSDFGFNINAGVRADIHSEYGTHWVYNVNPSYNFSKNIQIIASYSTAFIAPSTYQLFSQYGNLYLKPEENSTIEAGIIYSLKNILKLNAVFFYREVDNAIILPDYITYQNATETINAKGVEAEVRVDAVDKANFIFGYTYTYKSADLDYIPKNKFTALVETDFIKNTYLSLNFKNISKRTYFDQWGTGSNIDLKAYNLVDFYGSYTIVKNMLSVFVQVNNIFNEDYVETIGYTTKGRNYKIGLDFNF
jgi:vitamin B12 transporter